MSVKYGTQEWYDVYKEMINESKSYEEAEVVTDIKKYNPEFIILAPYHIWKRICLKQLDSTQALITKQSKLMTGSRGTMAKIMRYTKAANELTNITAKIDTEWLD